MNAACAPADGTCLSPAEAAAVDEIWRGPTSGEGKPLWRGIERGAPLGLLAGPKPFPYAILQPRYWVYLDPDWDWHGLTLKAYPDFFRKSVATVAPVMAGDEAALAPFFARGGRIIVYHGFDDSGILPHGSIDFYEAVAQRMHLSPEALRSRLQLFLFPGVGHCGGGDAPQPPVDAMMDALVAWVEQGIPPHDLVAVQERPNGSRRSRPVCAYPDLPYYRGRGDPDRASSFECRTAPSEKG